MLSNCPNCGVTMPKFALTCPLCGYKARLSQPLIGAARPEPLVKPGKNAAPNSTDSAATLPGKGRCLACGASVDLTKIKCWKCGNSLVSAYVAKELKPGNQVNPPTRNSLKEVKRENRKRKFLRSIKKIKFSR